MEILGIPQATICTPEPPKKHRGPLANAHFRRLFREELPDPPTPGPRPLSTGLLLMPGIILDPPRPLLSLDLIHSIRNVAVCKFITPPMPISIAVYALDKRGCKGLLGRVGASGYKPSLPLYQEAYNLQEPPTKAQRSSPLSSGGWMSPGAARRAGSSKRAKSCSMGQRCLGLTSAFFLSFLATLFARRAGKRGLVRIFP